MSIFWILGMAALSMLVLIGVFGGLLVLYWRFFLFFRDPERNTPEGNHVIAPADGRVVYIKPVADGVVPIAIKKGRVIRLEELTKSSEPVSDEQVLIGIFMFPWSVHVNRAPIDGVVENVRYFEARNLPMTLMWIKSMLHSRPYEAGAGHILQNERNTITFAGRIRVSIIQIADLYVRKIVSYVRPGQEVAMGERVGLIKMGSQVDILFPKMSEGREVQIQVEEGQDVLAGETILASYEKSLPRSPGEMSE